MAARTSWQYCQIEVGQNSYGVLRQFYADRGPAETQLYTNWPAMVGKLGDQGWELVNVVSGGTKHGPLIYVFKRPIAPSAGAGVTGGQQIAAQTPPPPPAPAQPKGPSVQWEPLDADDENDDGNGGFEPLRGI